jgi:hypothetical protein
VEKSKHRFEFHVVGDGSERGLIEAALPHLSPQLVWHGWKVCVRATTGLTGAAAGIIGSRLPKRRV